MKKLLIILISCLLYGCGGGGGGSDSSSSTTPTPTTTTPPTTPTTTNNSANQIPVVVSRGPGNNMLNGLYGSITICNSSNVCQVVNNVIMDTGSVGVRVLGSALPPGFLTATPISGGGTVGTCTPFADGYTWGDQAAATVGLGTLKTTAPVQIQVIGQSNYPVPSPCSSGNGPSKNDLSSLSANGIIGIGVFAHDCGDSCVYNATNIYYNCNAGACTTTKMPLANQTPNPISAMPAPYNNGNVVSLPAIGAGGANNVAGNIYLGINTVTNNTITPSTILNTDNSGYITATLLGQKFSSSFFDTGSSIYGINTNQIPLCTQSQYTTYYCPTTSTNVSVVFTSNINPTQTTTSNLVIDNAYNLLQSNNNAYYNIANQFVWASSADIGLTFFFGKNIATGLEGSSSSLGSQMYFAF